MSRPRTFRQEDVTRALRAADKAGQEVRRVEIHTRDQKIVLVIRDDPAVDGQTEPFIDPATIVL